MQYSDQGFMGKSFFHSLDPDKESLIGLLIRISDNYGLTPNLFLNYAKETQKSIFCDIQDPHHLSEWASLSVAKMPHNLLQARWLMTQYCRWCPQCLREEPFWRASWELSLVTTCTKHQTILLDRCQVCGNKPTIHRAALLRCDCGAFLADQQAEMTEANSLIENALCQQLYSDASGDGIHELPGWLSSLSIDGLHKVVLFFAATQQSKSSRRTSLKSDVNWTHQAIQLVEHLISDWPENYYRLLDDVLRRRSTESRIRRQFGYLYDATFKELKDQEFEPLRIALKTYMQTRWPGILDKRHSFIDADTDDQRYITITEAKKRYQLPARTLKTWITTGQADGRIYQLDSGRARILIARSDLDRLLVEEKPLNLLEVSQWLGIPESRVLELLAENLLLGNPPQPGQMWQIPVSTVRALLAWFESQHTHQLTESLTWNHVFRHGLNSELTLPDVIRGIGDKRIHIQRPAQLPLMSLMDIRLDKTTFSQWRQQQIEGRPIPLLAQELGVKQEVIYHWVNKGILVTQDYGRYGRRVPDNEVSRFKASYITAKTMAEDCKTSPKNITSRLTRLGVLPISGPTVDGGRQYLYKRQDIPVNDSYVKNNRPRVEE